MKRLILKINLVSLVFLIGLFFSTSAIAESFYDSNGYRSNCSSKPGDTKIYVEAAAPAGGDGSILSPYNSLADVMAHSAPGDVICVKQSTAVLDGGIVLKDGQKLIGIGPSVLSRRDPLGIAPKITNKDPSCLNRTPCDAHAVTLAEDNEVAGIHVIEPDGSGIYGKDLINTNIHHVRITNANLRDTFSDLLDDCGRITNNPIMLSSVENASVYKTAIDGYHWGIFFRAAQVKDFYLNLDNVKIESPRPNFVFENLNMDPIGIHIQTFAPGAVIHANIHNSTVLGLAYNGTFGTNLGLGVNTILNPTRQGLILADIDSVFYQAAHNNGIELVSYDNSQGMVDAEIRNSIFASNGDNVSMSAWNIPQVLNLFGCNATVPDPNDPAAYLKLTVDHSIIREGRAGPEVGRGTESGVYTQFRRFLPDEPPNATLDLTVQNTSIINSDGRSVNAGGFGPLSVLQVGTYFLDYGGGVNGSVGNNRIFGGGLFDVWVSIPNHTLSMQHNWWGDPAGLDPTKIGNHPNTVNSFVDASNPLLVDPGAPVLDAGTHGVDDDACGDNLMEYNGHGYQMCRVLDGDYVDDQVEAEQACIAVGGALPTVDNQDERDFLVRVFNAAFWVETGNADCAKFNTDTGVEFTASCDSFARVVCEFN